MRVFSFEPLGAFGGMRIYDRSFHTALARHGSLDVIWVTADSGADRSMGDDTSALYDTWTPFKPCAEFMAAAKALGSPVELKSYPGAVHAFDAPNLERRELPAYRVGNGPTPVIGTDREARADAFVRVLEFMKRQLE